ncbi:MAG: (d)CMP kinase [Eubacteriales bacterium]
MMSFQIAIDGPAGAGKSTVARMAAKDLGFIYVDTGAMYRAMGLYFHDNNVDIESEEEVNRSLSGADVELKIVDGVQHVLLNGEDVTKRIREEKAGMLASKTSQYPENRKKMTEMQRRIARTENVVMDGRDIGTVVLPDAGLKIYLTASVETRARRRFLELEQKGQSPDLEKIKADIEQRDYQDMHREVAPLKQADDAVYLDTSDMTAREAADKIIGLAKERMTAGA